MIPQRRTDDSKRSRLSNSYPGSGYKEIPSIQGGQEDVVETGGGAWNLGGI